VIPSGLILFSHVIWQLINATRFKFGQPTYGNCAALTIDGKFTFSQIYQHLSSARRTICIISYDLEPALRFARRYSIEKEDDVTESECEKPIVHAYPSEGTRKYSLERLLINKVKQGVDVKIIVWQPRLLFRSLPGADERGIDGRAEEVESMDKLTHKLHLKGTLTVRIDSTAPTFTSAHHEKVIVIDSEIAFCGGIDLSKGKWDTSNHAYDSPLRDSNSEPWHDIGVVVRGPVVADLEYHFHQRWHYANAKDAAETRKASSSIVYRPAVAGEVPIVALRTWKGFERTGGIRAWYANMFKNAKFSIYIENQFPFQDNSITNILVRRLEADKALKVIIISPLEPNLPGLIGKVLSGVSLNDVNRNLSRLRKAGGDRVRTYCLITETEAPPLRRRQIYVHSKLMIADDKWITIGSANLDKNGMRDSSEVNLGITSEKLARALRIRLWKEHTGDHISNHDVAHPDRGFDALDNVASSNVKRISENRPILGHLYYYDFKERGAPSPYPDAKSFKRLVLP
jgi:phosphatidylserine/phosphatidylglycerophosphate/cardiolipin synthase-like enzyme